LCNFNPIINFHFFRSRRRPKVHLNKAEIVVRKTMVTS
jgi:hypothetical protein